jgi:pSer/pThr/pTyr-binding forkhead associated (FHA) protein
MFKLVIQDDEGKTTVVPLIRDEITIGRKEGNTIRLTERNVSRRHARILRNNGEVQIEDLGSYNGIRVNNARIAERVSLRVSDQVQIGDYKLYLKAEGVEQVDDARTMPIERVDALPTDVMPAMQAPTTPMAAQAAAAPAAQPNRSHAAVADTDPQGRPVATAAQVAALSQPMGYGKLVVISSNFAGKEFDLTRPQMIVGRTDENDIVVNHRSISRNHAKVTRDPDTGRYTISDLQSSNGVRVNGQDYGKVELRRGDTVDLGHVRLRFVEPGEDFVFARDAVIADVPEAGGRKGLLVAVVLAVLVLGGVGAFLAFKKDDTKVAGPGSDQGSAAGTGSEQVAVNVPSGEEPGSGTTNVVTPDTPDAPTQQVVTPPPNDIAGSITVECKQYALDKKWTDANTCADRLAQHDAKTAKVLKAQYKQELENDLTLGRITDAVNKNELPRARKELAAVEEDSVYRKDAERMVEDLQAKLTARYRDEALAMKRSGKCDGFDRLVAEARDKGGPAAQQAVLREKCEKAAPQPPEPKDCSDRLVDGTKACKQQFCAKNPGDAKCGGGAVVVTPPANCDADALKEEGMQHINMGAHAAALSKFEASLKCKRDPYVIQLAFMEACSSSNPVKAKLYYKQLTPAQQQKFAQICIRQKVEYQ